ncbi:MAG: trigger factor [Betaproteobacteria bacterium RIFCSPLOWO2_12_FULL_62_13]|nr:MAG: trigger factor [Betaproteobacteria bacterium RIFCSPLOWO2_12_FULL_62_13]
MQANLETLGRLERRLSVVVPIAEIESEVENRLKRLSRTVKLHGFRPGKVPLKVVAQQFGSQVRQEVLGATLEKSFGDAVRQQNLRVAGYPRFEAKPLAEGASQFEYSATFEVYPDIAVGDLSQITIGRPVLVVGEPEVDKTIEIMRKQRATFEPAERAAEQGDRLTITYRGTIDDNEFSGSSARDQAVVLGDGRRLPDFDKRLLGMKAGEVKTFELRFPDDYHGKEVAGKTARFEVTVAQIAVPGLPALDAEFAKKLGVADGDLAKMRAEVKANLEREVKVRLKNRVKDRVMQALLDVTRIEAPKSLVEAEVQRLHKLARHDLAGRGLQVKEDTRLPVELFEKRAQRRVSLGLILAELVQTHNLYAKPEQVRAVVEEQAQSYEHPEEVVKWFYQAPERLREIDSAVVEDNVVAWALAAAKVEDTAIAFDELMGNQQ